MPVDSSVKSEIEQFLAGSCRPANDAADEFGLNEDLVNQIMTEAGHERCECCGWWCEDGEIDVIDDEYICGDCHES